MIDISIKEAKSMRCIQILTSVHLCDLRSAETLAEPRLPRSVLRRELYKDSSTVSIFQVIQHTLSQASHLPKAR
jgi:hypothetical protein